MAGIRIERARTHSYRVSCPRDRRQIRDGIAFEVAVVNPDGLEAQVLGAQGVSDHLAHIASRGKPETDAAARFKHAGALLFPMTRSIVSGAIVSSAPKESAARGARSIV